MSRMSSVTKDGGEQDGGKPKIIPSNYWDQQPIDSFSLGSDSDELYTSSWRYPDNKWFDSRVKSDFSCLQTALLAGIGKKSDTISLVGDSHLSQVPWHPSLLPSYQYWASSLADSEDPVRCFRISNIHLPPSFLANNITSVFERNSNEHDYFGNMTSLRLHNCSLSEEDLIAVGRFLEGNETLRALCLSRQSLGNEAVGALASGIDQHKSLLHLNLAESVMGDEVKALSRLLYACRDLDSLSIGHEDFTDGQVGVLAKYLGKKLPLDDLSIFGISLSKENKKILQDSLHKKQQGSSPLKEILLCRTGFSYPSIIKGSKLSSDSLSNLICLDMSCGSLPKPGAEQLGKILALNTSLEKLILQRNNMSTKSACALLPGLKENSTLQVLDLHNNCLTDKVAPAVIDMLKSNSTLRDLDLSGNNSLKGVSGGNSTWSYLGRVTKPVKEGGRIDIEKQAILDTTSLQAVVESNHSCGVTMGGRNWRGSNEATLRRINALDCAEGKKIRLKVLLAINQVNKDLYSSVQEIGAELPLEMVPYLVELVQQEIGVAGVGQGVVDKMRKRHPQKDRIITRIYEVISSYREFHLLFSRGSGVLRVTKKGKITMKKKKPQRRKRRFGDEGDSDDEDWHPNKRR